MHVFDIETNAIDFKRPDFYKTAEVVHCIVVTDRDTGDTKRFRKNDDEDSIEEGVRFLMECDMLAGQNIHGFDIPVLQWLYPWFLPKNIYNRDSKIESEMWYPGSDLRAADFKAIRKKGKDNWIEPRLYGKHSLEAWGARIGCPKDDYSKRCKEKGIDPWGAWNQDMEDYCAQDVLTNIALFDTLESKFDYKAAEFGVWLENRVAPILCKQKQYGIAFDLKKAAELNTKLTAKSEELVAELRKEFPMFYMRGGAAKTPKKTLNYKDKLRADYTKNASYTPVKLKEFNPGSGQHIALMLKRRYNWKPTEMTPSGEPKCDEDILSTLRYPCVPLILEYMTVAKRLGQLVHGNNSWLHHEKNGRIHGTVKQNGTRTTRASHVSPNLGQVPAVKKPFGGECRDLFTASKGRQIVGCDLSGIELRGLGHYLARYDGGSYAREAVEGDVHARAKVAINFNSRDNTKTGEYAFLYGAQDPKLGAITYEDMTPEQRKELGRVTKKILAALGHATRQKLQKGIKGLEPLVEAVHSAYERGRLRALDGRYIAVPSKHSALNTLLQHLGGILAKVWMVLAEDKFIAEGLQPDRQWIIRDPEEWVTIQLLFVHDELQHDCKPDYTTQVGTLLMQAAREAGELLKLRVVVDAEYKVGGTWKETH